MVSETYHGDDGLFISHRYGVVQRKDKESDEIQYEWDKTRYHEVRHVTLRMLQEYVDMFSVEVRQVGLNQVFQLRLADGE
nr:hypothetical protein VW1_00073 [Enterobacter sp.]